MKLKRGIKEVIYRYLGFEPEYLGFYFSFQSKIQNLKSKIPASKSVTLISLIALTAAILLPASLSLADNIGINKARILQTAEKTYVVEADVTQAFSWAIKAPIFPDRFKVSELEFITQTGWIIVQATATTDGEPLTPEDEILLPWMRNGAAISVQWLDGTVRQGLFLRSLEGIRVPMKALMQADKTLGEVCREHFLGGFHHLTFALVHVLFAAVLVLLIPLPKLFPALFSYTFGQGFSLILAELGVPGFDLLYADILGLILVFLLACGAVRNISFKPYLPLLFLFGLIHGLAYAREIDILGLPLQQNIPALFMFNLAVDLGQFGIAAIGAILLRMIAALPRVKHVATYAAGVLSVAVVCILFQDRVVTGNTVVLQYAEAGLATRYTLPASKQPQTGGSKPRGARQLTSPVMNYLSVEPFEVRQEMLVQARAAVQLLGVDDTGMGSIPVESQSIVKDRILSVVQKANPILIDGQPGELILSRADFVTLGAAGVIVRAEPVVESLDEGIIGLTLVYKTPDLADRIEMNWKMFSDTVQKVEATTTDPFGSASMVLSPDANKLEWKSRLSGFRVPVIEKIVVQKPRLPIISAVLFLLVLVLFLVSLRRRNLLTGQPVLLSVAALGFVLYPFARFPVDLPVASQWRPSTERTAIILDGLLTNVYRSFDVRDESDVYDRLALSVTGDQLTHIYLQNRQSLELENRGGARANVDEVKMETINKIKKAGENSFAVDAAWTVSGSVNHFGHTHYRRNYYHAMVTLVTDKGSWKIKEIELIDEKRLL